METQDKPYDLHLMICTNVRAPHPDGRPVKPSCGLRGSEEIKNDLKIWLREELIKRPLLRGKFKARVNTTGCLDFCTRGIAMALYPEGRFLLDVKNNEEDRAAIKALLTKKLDEAEAKIKEAGASV